MTENSMFSIECELRKLKEDISTNWVKMMQQLISVVFSGCAVNILSQNNIITSILLCFEHKYSWHPDTKYIIEIVLTLLILGFLVFVFRMALNIKEKVKDTKATHEDIRRLAEYFHKIIFNNITMGRSFLEKGLSCSVDYNKQDRELYLCESFYYFNIAFNDIVENEIFEQQPNRQQYQNFKQEVGESALKNTKRIFISSIEELMENLPAPEKKLAQKIYIVAQSW